MQLEEAGIDRIDGGVCIAAPFEISLNDNSLVVKWLTSLLHEDWSNTSLAG